MVNWLAPAFFCTAQRIKTKLCNILTSDFLGVILQISRKEVKICLLTGI